MGLRVQDIDASRYEILVHDGKGAKDRITMLPESLKAPFQEHLKTVKAIHESDRAEVWGRVQMPMAFWIASIPTRRRSGAGKERRENRGRCHICHPMSGGNAAPVLRGERGLW